MLSPVEITLIVVVGLLFILVILLLFKTINLSYKVNTVSDFINGEVFSTKFYELVQNYFSNKQHVQDLLDPFINTYNNIQVAETNHQKLGEVYLLD